MLISGPKIIPVDKEKEEKIPSKEEITKTVLEEIRPIQEESFKREIETKEKHNNEIIENLKDLKQSLDNQKKEEINFDLTPIVDFNKNFEQLLNNIFAQNREIIESFIQISKKDFKEEEFNFLYKSIIKMIESNNELAQRGIQIIDYSKELNQISEAINNRPKEWEMEVVKNNSRYKIFAKAIK